MKFLVVLSAVLAITVAETYSTAHDNIDVEALVTNPESLQAITKCFLDQGECSETAAAFKKVLPDAAATACAKCTPAQKHILRRYLEEVNKNDHDGAEGLKQKYDPEGQYLEALRKAIADA